MGAIIIIGIIGYIAYSLIKKDALFWKACGWIIVVFVGGGILISVIGGALDAYEERKDAEARELAEKEVIHQREEAIAREQAARKRKLFEREDKLRSFTLKEAPALWSTYQNLQSEVKVQDQKIEELRRALKEFNRDPESDADFKRICVLRDDMVGSLKTMRTKMEDAYLAARKYQATPSRKDYNALQKKLLEDGIQEAEAATRRFNQMKDAK